MNRSLIRSRSITVTLLLGFCSVMTVASLVVFPAQAFAASLAGLQFWWNIVFPAMLPYVILVKLAAEYGLFQLSGKVLAPLVRRLGLPPGAGSVLAAGIVLGYAEGTRRSVKGAAHGHQQNMALAATVSGFANPALVVVVLAAVLPGKASVFLFLLLVHYTSWLAAALLFVPLSVKRARRNGRRAGEPGQPNGKQPPSIRKNNTFGQVLGTSVTDGLQKMMELGGLIILFAVVSRMLQLFGVADLLAGLSSRMGLPLAGEAVMPLLAGFLDIHNGLLALSRSTYPTAAAVCFLAALLAWGGFAVHLDVRARLRQAGLRYGPYLCFRLLHIAASLAVTASLWPLVGNHLAPWPVQGERAAMDAAASLWPEPAGMPGAALFAACLAAVLLLNRRINRGR